ncbi:putative cation-transporting ATPase 13A4 [Rhinophrynus dorsalis]
MYSSSCNIRLTVSSISEIFIPSDFDFSLTEVVESRCLVPGDVIVVPENKFYMPCDAILITGGCIVNEGMLTGESVPVTKMPLPNVNNSVPWKTHCGDDYKKHVLFCGTEVIQTKSSNKGLVKAVVLHTGFNTTKGDLIRSILYPKPVNLKMYKDVIKFFMGLSALAVVGALYTALVLTKQDKRLQRTGIYCLSAQRINMCGRLNIICFDKTGTLTEDGMKLWGMIPSDGKWYMSGVPDTGRKRRVQPISIPDINVTAQSVVVELQEVKTPLGEEATSDIIVKPGENMEKVQVEGVTVLHQFPFSSSLQRMSVIAQVIGKDELLVYMKGAPEMVIQFSLPETVPLNFQEELELYALQGYRVIALAYKILTIKNHLNAKSLEREEVESGLTFLGLLIMENKLKPETKPVLQELQAANIRTVMITGDNLQTACTVGKVSGMVPDSEKLILIKARPPEGNSPASITWQAVEEKSINGTVKKDLETDIYEESCGYSKTNNFHFAINGKSYEVIEKYFYNMLPKILLNGTIFARMGPRQKTNLVEEIKKLDYFVGMCGDGANDCGALKTAHAGISLSETEASVASPFTSKTPNIECVTKLIKEGRNSLVTGFCMLKFVILNTMICLQTMLILFWKRDSGVLQPSPWAWATLRTTTSDQTRTTAGCQKRYTRCSLERLDPVVAGSPCCFIIQKKRRDTQTTQLSGENQPTIGYSRELCTMDKP